VDREKLLNTGDLDHKLLFIVPVLFLSILLHQSSELFGINLSFADFFCVFILVILVISHQLQLPIFPLIFFLIVSSIVIITSTFYVPMVFNIDINPKGIISDFLKLIALLVYFIIGFNLYRLDLMEKTLKWYSLFGMLIGLIGIMTTLLNINLLSEILYYSDTRYRGLMIDPNYYSVLQITAFIYFSRAKSIRFQYKVLALLITLITVLTSGSKTGLITLSCYLAFRIIEYLFKQNKKGSVILIQMTMITLLILVVPMLFHYLPKLIMIIGSIIPTFDRVQLLFTDFSSAISESGSGRNITWIVALQVIQLSPLIGVGIGTYSNIASKLYYSNDIPHNTFLQLSAEWGIPLAFLFFGYVIFLLVRISNSRSSMNLTINLVLRDIILVLLVASMAISLNNARILWLVLGALVCSLNRNNIFIRR